MTVQQIEQAAKKLLLAKKEANQLSIIGCNIGYPGDYVQVYELNVFDLIPGESLYDDDRQCFEKIYNDVKYICLETENE